MSRPALIACCGLPGVGKSTVSGYVADRLDASRYRSDEVRKELFPDPTYEPEETARTYDELLGRAREDLEAGRNVVLDATFSSRSFRGQADLIAREVDAECAFVRVTCEPGVLRRRIERRTETVSDAGYAEHLEVRETFDSFERDHDAIDNSGPIEETFRQVDHAVLDPIREDLDRAQS
ncbi:AAA family ATPase [Halovivax sp.]|uniref:AAA family ATPase n=1 Tax=Halovivax sp. TaxID=1935978 RepID=UPI0025BB1413|nr:AAA family ATPase [Halovivax sp.]